jgi:hypothetical protein
MGRRQYLRVLPAGNSPVHSGVSTTNTYTHEQAEAIVETVTFDRVDVLRGTRISASNAQHGGWPGIRRHQVDS